MERIAEERGSLLASSPDAIAARLAAEGLVSLAQVPRMLYRAASERRLSRAAVVRWALKGRRGHDGGVVRLEVTWAGQELATSRQAVGRFACGLRRR